MSSRYSAQEVRNIVEHIKIEAKMAGLIPMDAYMSYHPGNAANGISGHIDVFREDEDGYHTIRVDFLPQFTYKQSKTDHGKLLDAALNVFFAMRRIREEAARLVPQVNNEQVSEVSEAVWDSIDRRELTGTAYADLPDSEKQDLNRSVREFFKTNPDLIAS